MKKIIYLFGVFVVSFFILNLYSCSKDDEVEAEKTFDTSPVILFVNETKVIEGEISISKSEDTFVASIKNNTITANHVGQTKVVVNEKYHIPVTVMPKYLMMTSEPILDWGTTKEDIKSRWKLGTLTEKDNTLAYNDCGDATLVGYSFKNGKLDGVTIAVPMSKGIKFTNYLSERFFIDPREVKDQYIGFDAYTLEDAKTTIVYDISGNYKIGSTTVYTCVFMPANK